MIPKDIDELHSMKGMDRLSAEIALDWAREERRKERKRIQKREAARRWRLQHKKTSR